MPRLASTRSNPIHRKKPDQKIKLFYGGQDRIRTYEGARPADLQSAAFDHFATCPLEPAVGFEPTTCCLQNSCSTTELSRHIPANFTRNRIFFQDLNKYAILLLTVYNLETETKLMLVKKCHKIAGNLGFQNFILVVIVLNAAFMGLETSHTVVDHYGKILHFLDRIVQIIFVFEILIRLTAFWPSLGKFFRDGWNVFDFSVVTLSLLPIAGPFASVARLARVLRVTRIISRSEELRLIVGTMLRSIPSLLHVTLLLGLLLYVYGIIGWHLYQSIDPARWGTLGRALMTLFEVLTLEGWIDMQNAVIGTHPTAWLFFGSFIVIAVFVVVNLFIAVVLNNLQNVQASITKFKKTGKGK
jgi:voltage-gated sodium channel